MSPVFQVLHTVTKVSWSQKRRQNDNIHSKILDVRVFKVWRLKLSLSAELRKPNKIITPYVGEHFFLSVKFATFLPPSHAG